MELIVRISAVKKDKLQVLYGQICADCALKIGALVSIRVTSVKNQGERGW